MELAGKGTVLKTTALKVTKGLWIDSCSVRSLSTVYIKPATEDIEQTWTYLHFLSLSPLYIHTFVNPNPPTVYSHVSS